MCVCVVGLWRAPKTLLLLLATTAPFLIAWIDAARFGRAELRQLALAAPGVVVLLGVGLAVATRTCSGRVRWIPALLIVLLMWPGALLSPSAGWRTPTPSRQFLLGPLLVMARHGEVPQARLRAACVQAIGSGRSRVYGDLLLEPTR